MNTITSRAEIYFWDTEISSHSVSPRISSLISNTSQLSAVVRNLPSRTCWLQWPHNEFGRARSLMLGISEPYAQQLLISDQSPSTRPYMQPCSWYNRGLMMTRVIQPGKAAIHSRSCASKYSTLKFPIHIHQPYRASLEKSNPVDTKFGLPGV
jgi:hypothetical protein